MKKILHGIILCTLTDTKKKLHLIFFRTLTIFSAIKEYDDWQYSSGVKQGCRMHVSIEGKVTIRYLIKNKKKFGLFQSNEYELVLTSDRHICLPDLALKAKKGRLPLNENDGANVLRIDNNQECEKNQPVSIPFNSNTLPRNAKAKLFPVKNEDYSRLKLIRHPQSIAINP